MAVDFPAGMTLLREFPFFLTGALNLREQRKWAWKVAYLLPAKGKGYMEFVS